MLENKDHTVTASADSLDAPDGLQRFLGMRSIRTQNYELLQGGYTSTVFKARFEDNDIIIKHSRGKDVFYPVKRRQVETRAKTEVDVLNRLHSLFPQQVPQIYEFFPNESVIIMSDVGTNAQLGINYLLNGKARIEHAKGIGTFLGELKEATADWEPFETVEEPFEQLWTRGLEVDVASREWGEQMRHYYLGGKPGFVWPDGHPKNVFFATEDPLVRAIDFDCSHFADQDYMLPNFLGQIPVFATMGHISAAQGTAFIEEMVKAYTKVVPISPSVEKKMVFYAGTQTIQRQDGKWLFDVCGGNDEKSLRRKSFLFYFGRKVITSAETFAEYIDLFKKSTTEWGAMLDNPE